MSIGRDAFHDRKVVLGVAQGRHAGRKSDKRKIASDPAQWHRREGWRTSGKMRSLKRRPADRHFVLGRREG
ncbi:hypothetical protein HBI56_069830 [Parastagonospora nodorum]|uniref:Uncharacterized protein n=1 Tax=Phaeosphaeria nodorum (strain SN15 / ATCC MYA-4574 / FGSC 10173) TaxID=321614 RepID=A0A7U2EP05_PHANO|nr:hypothetical protein HBH56_004270 [Parastagonospora nodorum]QRC90332.1 hypothetical protein JI435_400370 [Parastagonospora nodorum SN15]KAH3938018.1 hypothetical protein HBH54_004260 [Parastagonospora nodorum]KAH4053036.1 hypothetical protein HBH49_094060 [Parastagonospora nodorum]KAH4145769.1 hypothetical protein HBH45_008140 [Parastagonospora nodorum]